MPAFAGMTNYDTVSKGRGEITFDKMVLNKGGIYGRDNR